MRELQDQRCIYIERVTERVGEREREREREGQSNRERVGERERRRQTDREKEIKSPIQLHNIVHM